MTEKDEAARSVLRQRFEILRDKVLPICRPGDKEYYTGKMHGYMQAYELLGDTIECIKIELDEPEPASH